MSGKTVHTFYACGCFLRAGLSHPPYFRRWGPSDLDSCSLHVAHELSRLIGRLKMRRTGRNTSAKTEKWNGKNAKQEEIPMENLDCLILQFSEQKNVRPGFLISHFSQSSENEKTRTYTSRHVCRKMQNPIEILREKIFSGRRNGPRNFYTVPVSLFRVFKNFLTDYASLFKGHLVRVFKKNPPFFLPFFFLILFSSFFLSSSLRTHFNV